MKSVKKSAKVGLQLANNLFDAGNLQGTFKQLLILRKRFPRNTQVQEALANMARKAGDDVPNSPKLIKELVCCLINRQGDAREILCAAGVILGRNEGFFDTLTMLSNGASNHNREAILAGSFKSLFKNQLFSALLANTCLTNIRYEMAMVALRHILLASITDDEASLDCIKQVSTAFCSALAQQCWLNEYVYALELTEHDHVNQLRTCILEQLNNEEKPNPWLEARLLVFLTYQPFHELSTDAKTWQRWQKNWPSSLHWVLQKQTDFQAEQELKVVIPSFGLPKDKTSLAVKKQYENNPYPRWFNLPMTRKTSVGEYLSLQYPHFQSPKFLYQPVHLLNAGCGTGREALSAHATLKTSRIKAIDLSMSSLAYAARMARVFGADNDIDFIQADILRLPELFHNQAPFDLICSSGVLHHMEKPIDGWRTLVQLLRPGGVMRIGLYSAHARRQVFQARERIQQQGLDATPTSIRKFRQTIFKGYEPTLLPLAQLSDLFTLSASRDLLFHVCEWNYTLPEIKDCLEELGLTFIGFEGIETTKAEYARHWSTDNTMTNLDNWNLWEQEHPDTFSEMYNMVLQKQPTSLLK